MEDTGHPAKASSHVQMQRTPLMNGDLAVVMDVAGTMLRMYRVAKDIETGTILEKVITWKLIMEKANRALVVPQMDPSALLTCPPDDTLARLFSGLKDIMEVSCSSSPMSKEQAFDIVCRSRVSVRDLREVYLKVIYRCPDIYHTAGLIVDADRQDVVFSLSTGGAPFPGLEQVLADLKRLGADVIVASGDSMRSLSRLTRLGIDLSRVYPVSSPQRKKEIVADLKNRYRHVVMVGDGLNDIYALQTADLGILTVQQDTRPSPGLLSAADEIIDDIRKLPILLRKYA